MRTSNIIMLLTAPLALAACNSGENHDAMDEMSMEGHDMSAMSESPATTSATAVGEITAIDPDAGTITIDHEPVPELQWPQMIMAFEVDEGVGTGLAVGDSVTFEFSSGEDGNEISSISKK